MAPGTTPDKLWLVGVLLDFYLQALSNSKTPPSEMEGLGGVDVFSGVELDDGAARMLALHRSDIVEFVVNK